MSEPNDWWSMTDARDSILIVIDGPADTTIRPLRPNIPRDYPHRPAPPPQKTEGEEKPPSQKKDDKKPPSEEEGDQKTPE
jgi:hypothetical protein